MKQEQDILKELKELNSTLATLPKTMPYEIPVGYFDGLAQNITQLATADVTLTKDIPFATPDGYFDNLPEQILQAAKADRETITTEPKPKSRSIWLNVRWAAAAMLILSISIGSYRILNPGTISIQEQLDEIPEAAILAYVQDNIDEFDIDYIITNIESTNTIQTVNIQDEAIEDYLESSGWQ